MTNPTENNSPKDSKSVKCKDSCKISPSDTINPTKKKKDKIYYDGYGNSSSDEITPFEEGFNEGKEKGKQAREKEILGIINEWWGNQPKNRTEKSIDELKSKITGEKT